MSDIQRYIRTLNPERYMHLFDSEQYLKMYPNLVEKKINPMKHWIQCGQYNPNRIAPLTFKGSLEQLCITLNDTTYIKSKVREAAYNAFVKTVEGKKNISKLEAIRLWRKEKANADATMHVIHEEQKSQVNSEARKAVREVRKAERDARKAEREAKAKSEAEAKAKGEAEAKAKGEAEAKAKSEAEAKAKAEAEVKAKAEAEAKSKAIQMRQIRHAKAKADAEVKAKAEVKAEAKAKADAEAKAKADAKAKAEAEAKAKAEAKAEAKAKAKAEAEAEAKAKAEHKRQLRRAVAEMKAKSEAIVKTKLKAKLRQLKHQSEIESITKVKAEAAAMAAAVAAAAKQKLLAETNMNQLSKFLSIKNSTVLVNTHSNLNYTAGDTIMISNYINVLMDNNNKIILVTSNTVNNKFKSNLIKDKYSIIVSKDIVKTIDEQEKYADFIFIRNHNILKYLLNKSYLHKTYFYGLDVHLQDISNFKNNIAGVITQSEQLKKKYLDNGVTNEKIQIIEPFSYNYNFNLPERTDNEIRLVYCGTLRDEENILEIIEEFQKIHKERPEVLLKIVYGKIHGNPKFTEMVNEYIKDGVDGITFKHNLSHKDACYEIATSDIGICWRKNGWGDNGEMSTKVKEYDMYGVCVCKISPYKLFTFENINFISNYGNNGYAKRTEYMRLESTLILINPVIISLNNCIDFKNNIFIGYLSVKFLKNNYFKNVKNIIISSNNSNFNSIYPIINKMNIPIIYDIRGLWYFSHKAHIDSGTKLVKHKRIHLDYENEERKEIKCINKSDKIICISNSCYNYLHKKYYVNKQHLIFPNCINNEESLNIKPHEKKSTFKICYFGSIVPYEGIHNLINVCKELIVNKLNIKLIIVGSVSVYDNIDFNHNFIERYEWLEKDKLNEILSNIHLVCLPRVNSEACRMIPPLKVAECIGKNLPLLTPDYQIFKEISDNGNLFCLYKEGELYNGIKNIYYKGYDLSKLEKAKNYYTTNMSWSLYKEKMKKFLAIFLPIKPINILFEITDLHYIYNLLELKKRIKFEANFYMKLKNKDGTFLKIYNKNKYFLQLLNDNKITFLNIIIKFDNIVFDKIIPENSYFRELTSVKDPILNINKCNEKLFFKGYNNYGIDNTNIIVTNFMNNNKKLNVLGIFDEMFYENIKFLFNITLCRNDKDYCIPKNIDMFIVESCWNGNNGDFKTVISCNRPILKELVHKCKQLNIPTVFINKEDYINYDTFIHAAKLFDYVFTSDINCINKYKKDCLNAKGIYNHLFFINMHYITQNSKFCEYNKETLFAGSWTFRKHGSRNEDMIELFDECLKNELQLDIIDRNSKTNTINVFPNKYSNHLYHSVDYNDLIHYINHKYEYILNLNSVNNSETMFARRIIELLAQKKIVISNYTPAINKYFKNIVFQKNDINNILKLSLIKKEIIKHNGYLQVYKYFTDKYFYNNLLNCLDIDKFKDYKIASYEPKVSVICSSNRVNNLKIIVDNFNKQVYKNKELLICVNLDAKYINLSDIEKYKLNNNTKIIILDEKYTLGYCLNKLIEYSTGEIIQKMDDDDYYSENFIQNQVMMYDIYNADLVGKSCYFTYIKNTKSLYIRKYKNNLGCIFTKSICGSTTSFLKKHNLKYGTKNQGEDTELIINALDKKLNIVNSNIFDYCYIRHGDINEHSWKITNKELINEERDKFIEKYDSIPKDVIDGKL